LSHQSNAERPLQRLEISELFLLAAIWGASFLFMRITAPVFGPVFLIELRVLVGLLVLLPFLFISGQPEELLRHWKIISVVGLTSMGLPFVLLAYTSLSLGAGLLSILNATVPFFAAVLGYIMYRERLGRAAKIGLVTGFTGVAVLALGDTSATGSNFNGLAFLAGLLAACLYGFSTNIINKHLLSVNGLTITTGSLAVSSLYLAPFAFTRIPDQMPGLAVWISVLALGAVCTGLAYILFYRLIGKIGAYRTVTVTFLVPVFSIFYGRVFLNESLSITLFAGSLLVLFGVAIATGRVPFLK